MCTLHAGKDIQGSCSFPTTIPYTYCELGKKSEEADEIWLCSQLRIRDMGIHFGRGGRIGRVEPFRANRSDGSFFFADVSGAVLCDILQRGGWRWVLHAVSLLCLGA